jgi:hypothetical protein
MSPLPLKASWSFATVAVVVVGDPAFVPPDAWDAVAPVEADAHGPPVEL